MQREGGRKREKTLFDKYLEFFCFFVNILIYNNIEWEATHWERIYQRLFGIIWKTDKKYFWSYSIKQEKFEELFEKNKKNIWNYFLKRKTRRNIIFELYTLFDYDDGKQSSKLQRN